MENTKYEELDALRKEIGELLAPYEKREKELRTLVEQEDIDRQKAIFKKYEGKVYYTTIAPFNGTGIRLIKAISCNDWSAYNSCVVFAVTIEYDSNGKCCNIWMKKDTHRVDSFEKYQEVSEEIYEKFKLTAETELANALSIFK